MQYGLKEKDFDEEINILQRLYWLVHLQMYMLYYNSFYNCSVSQL